MIEINEHLNPLILSKIRKSVQDAKNGIRHRLPGVFEDVRDDFIRGELLKTMPCDYWDIIRDMVIPDEMLDMVTLSDVKWLHRNSEVLRQKLEANHG